MANGKHNTGPQDQNAIPLDHFFQLVLMHERTRRAWMKVHGNRLADAQEHLAQSRAELLERLSQRKKAKK